MQGEDIVESLAGVTSPVVKGVSCVVSCSSDADAICSVSLCKFEKPACLPSLSTLFCSELPVAQLEDSSLDYSVANVQVSEPYGCQSSVVKEEADLRSV